MHRYLSDRITYCETDFHGVDFLVPDFTTFTGHIVQVSSFPSSYRGYDDWTNIFSRSDEMNLIRESISEVSLNPQKRIHIRGISTAESVELIRSYYRVCGYEDSLAKNYILPAPVSLTVSVSLTHVLWCEKDKNFLDSQYQGISYGEICPPVRSPHDLRALQQALRMGIIMGIEISSREHEFLSDLLARQVVSPFLLGRLLFYNWQKYGFTGI